MKIKKRKKTINCIIILIAILLLFGYTVAPYIIDIFKIEKQEAYSDEEYYNWNHGHCINCGHRLEYKSCGNKYTYYCPNCDKEYTFNKAQNYND